MMMRFAQAFAIRRRTLRFYYKEKRKIYRPSRVAVWIHFTIA